MASSAVMPLRRGEWGGGGGKGTSPPPAVSVGGASLASPDGAAAPEEEEKEEEKDPASNAPACPVASRVPSARPLGVVEEAAGGSKDSSPSSSVSKDGTPPEGGGGREEGWAVGKDRVEDRRGTFTVAEGLAKGEINRTRFMALVKKERGSQGKGN